MICEENPKSLGWISKLLALWIAIAIVIGLALGKYFPEFSSTLQVGISIELFFMIYPAMTKIEISELKSCKKPQANLDNRLLQLCDKPVSLVCFGLCFL